MKILLAAACVLAPMVAPMAASASPVAVQAVPSVVASGAASPATPRPAAVTPPAGASKYVRVAPLRLADTRPTSSGYGGFTDVSGDTIRVGIIGRAGVPANATAAVLNVTIAGTSEWSFATVFPGATALPAPLTSSLNADASGRVIANLVHVKIGGDGAANIYRSASMGLVVDLVGVYVPVTGPSNDGRLVTRADGAKRVLDTRGSRPINATETFSVDVSSAGVPTSASAVVVNLTAVTANSGFWSAFPADKGFSGTSSLNLDTNGQTRAGQAIVNLVGTNRFNVYTENGGNLLVDVVGWFTGATEPASTDGLYVPAAPSRVFDSRSLRYLAPWSGSTYEFSPGNGGGLTVAAAVLNITATLPWDLGFVTAYPARVARPNSSNLNISEVPQTIANHSIVRVSTAGVALFTQGGTHLIADVAGWYLGAPSVASLAPPTNPVYNPNPAVAVSVPKIGVYVAVKSGGGSLDRIADQGYAATWSDINTVAAPGNLMLFGHRTVGSAPFRYLDAMNVGDAFSIIGSDGFSYNYRIEDISVTLPSYSAIQRLANPYGPITAQLVACSKLNGTATSLAYRIVVTGRLASIT